MLELVVAVEVVLIRRMINHGRVHLLSKLEEEEDLMPMVVKATLEFLVPLLISYMQAEEKKEIV